MRDFKIFIDLDEVTYNLSSEITKIMNEEHNTKYKASDNQSYWWLDFGLPQSYFESLLCKKGTFLKGKSIPGAIETLDKLHGLGFDIHILTAPQISEYSYYEKATWVQENLPWIDLERNFHTTHNKSLMAASDRILLDDSSKNTKEWCNEGGVSICFGDYGWNKDWNGFRASNWEQVYELILAMEEIKSE